MAEVVERLDSVERRLTSVEKGLTDLREEVGGLRGEVGGLRGEVHKLRILGEKNETNITVIAEAQVQHGSTLEHHGRKLDEITNALEPLARIDAFVQLVAGDHQKRISDLERHTNS
jgi:hypothetical protein